MMGDDGRDGLGLGSGEYDGDCGGVPNAMRSVDWTGKMPTPKRNICKKEVGKRNIRKVIGKFET